jgi:hypothetical protein
MQPGTVPAFSHGGGRYNHSFQLLLPPPVFHPVQARVAVDRIFLLKVHGKHLNEVRQASSPQLSLFQNR